MKCDVDLRKDLFRNIVLAGGTSLLPGLSARLAVEVEKLAPTSYLVEVTLPASRAYAAWLGGSLFASTSAFASQCATRADYDEYGPDVLATSPLASMRSLQ